MSDKVLLESLHEALDAGKSQPSAESLLALRAHLSRSRPLPPSPIGPVVKKIWPVRVALSVVIAAALLGGVAASGVVPDPLRDAFHSIGLPIDSSTHTEARVALRDLAIAIQARDPAAAEAADERLLRLLALLDAEEMASLGPVAHEVHQRAQELTTGAPDDPIAP